VPFQLVTREFNEKISAILSDDGVYMINLIDIFDSGLFVGSVINTLEETFPYVYAATENKNRLIRNTFVIIAAKHKLDLKNIISQSKKGEEPKLWYLDSSDISKLGQKSRHLVLTDDYCPVENLLAPVVHDNAREVSSEKYLERAEELQRKGRFAESIENYLSATKIYPAVSIRTYNEIGIMHARMGNLEQAVEALNKAIQYNDESGHKSNTAILHYNLGIMLKKLGKSEQATEQFRIASSELQKEVEVNPTSHVKWADLGDTLAAMGDFKAAIEAFKEALALNPDDPAYYYNLAKVLEYDGRYGEAIEVLKKQIQLMKDHKQDEAASPLQGYLKFLEDKNSKSK
jgi:tetratricopeptide (TPR) repeat protein